MTGGLDTRGLRLPLVCDLPAPPPNPRGCTEHARLSKQVVPGAVSLLWVQPLPTAVPGLEKVPVLAPRGLPTFFHS